MIQTPKRLGMSMADRIDRLSVPVTESGCWLWIGATVPSGYGKITIQTGGRGATHYAHRVSWACHSGQAIPAGMYVCHKCDTPLCVNPSHLFVGTASENGADALAKGRRTLPKSKITDMQAMEIMASSKPCKVVGAMFGVSGSTIHLIRKGRRKRFSSAKDQSK